MTETTVKSYSYDDLPCPASFRVAEILPGVSDDPIVCRLHAAEWHQRPQYDAVSYNWGSTIDSVEIGCNGKVISITRNLYNALTHFRPPDQSRVLWADGLCHGSIDQTNVPERGLQVKQMRTIYKKADHEAKPTVAAIYAISEYLADRLGINLWHTPYIGDTYQETLMKNIDLLPPPDRAGFDSDALLQALVWFYSHRYFIRVWAIQEVAANERCKVHVGDASINWNRGDLVACYMILDEAFSQRHGSSKSYQWFVASFAELLGQPKRWLNTLYLASNFGCVDARDVVYGLRGLMSLDKGASLLDPDYHKTTEEVYQDCTEAAFENFQNTDVLNFVTGNEHPSWVPRWDRAMMFRNPFRFGKPMPWTPSAFAKAEWSIDRATSILSLTGVVADVIDRGKTYSQLWFSDKTLNSKPAKTALVKSWSRIFAMFMADENNKLIPQTVLTSIAVTMSFGMNRELSKAERDDLLLRFVANLRLVLEGLEQCLAAYISTDLLSKSRGFDAHAFGKPVWDFDYPDGSIFITKGGLVGCCISTTRPEDCVFVAHGSTYPLAVRVDSTAGEVARYTIRGFSFVDGIMHEGCTITAVTRLRIC